MVDSRDPSRHSRRAVLTAGALAGGAALAGCLGVTDVSLDADSGSDADADSASVDRERARSRPTLGDPDAPVTVAVYSDFACPHCHSFTQETLPKLRERYIEPGDISYEHHDFPLPLNEAVSWQAPQAARSVLGQTDAATFFEYAELVFSNFGSLSPETYGDLAEEVGADGGLVESAVRTDRYRETVEADRQAGVERGVGATPTVFVDEENAAPHGRLGYSGLVQVIESHL